MAHAPNALSLNTLCRGYCGQGPRVEPTNNRHKNSIPLSVSTTRLNLAFRGSHFFPAIPCPVPMITSTRSLYVILKILSLNFTTNAFLRTSYGENPCDQQLIIKTYTMAGYKKHGSRRPWETYHVPSSLIMFPVPLLCLA